MYLFVRLEAIDMNGLNFFYINLMFIGKHSSYNIWDHSK